MKVASKNKKDNGRKMTAGAKFFSIFAALLVAYAFVYFVMESKDDVKEKGKAVITTTVTNEPLTTVISDESAKASAMLESIKVSDHVTLSLFLVFLHLTTY